ncbi:MAG: leucine--tRNA ligase [Actinomycetota bacterium]
MEKSTSQKTYNATKIEKKWTREWNRQGIYNLKTSKDDPKYYMLEMFPYPSGEPHMGHARNYTIGDVAARVLQRKGRNVLHPIGFDAFGLPAENAAIKSGVHPRESTLANIEKMRAALKRMGIAYDFSDEIITSEPDYYRWTQWLFLLFYRMGLAEKKEAPVNWCNSCQTVLANEQVIGGKCERCDSSVEKKVLSQWFLKITRYAQRLLDDMEMIEDGWPERVLAIQRNWIGRSEGATVNFKLADDRKDISIPVFTTRPDTLYGVTFFILAPEHELVEEVTSSQYRDKVEEIKKKISGQSDIERGAAETEKIGCFTGGHVSNPLNGEKVPVWVANYVLLEYGTGAIMAVPAHDERDFEFARKYGIPIRQVISPDGSKSRDLDSAYPQEGIMVNSGPFTGMPSEEGKKKITGFLEEKGIGRFEVNYKLKDWLISRQRYWGAPIPIIYCDKCGTVPVPEEQLPVKLPYDVDFNPTGLSPLAYCEQFVNTACPSCGGKAERETDTMDTFVCSSWYFLRYCSPHEQKKAFDRKEVDYWMPVDHYIGGIEHATMHLIYSRFFTKALYDAGLVGFKEPFTRYFPHGVVNLGGKRMSKSRGNLVRPSEIYNRYGSDTLRLYILFMGPADSAVDWSDSGVEGANRFLSRVWRLVEGNIGLIENSSSVQLGEAGLKGIERETYKKLHQTIKKVTEDILGRFNFNTAISALMELVNLVYKYEEEVSGNEKNRALVSELNRKLLILLSPIAPFITEELWHMMGNKNSIHQTPWPDYDRDAAREEAVTIVFQVNGKVRDKADLSVGLPKEEVEKHALASDNVQRFIEGKKVVKSIMVPDKLINFVVK